MAVLRFVLSLPWLLLREVLIRSDRDYWRMLSATSEPHSLSGYWEFVEARQAIEVSGMHDRTNIHNWDDVLEDDEEDEFDEEDDNQFDEESNSGKSRLKKAEEMLGLEEGDYDEKEMKRAFAQAMKTAHPDHGGTDEAARAVNNARDVIRKHHGWD